LAIQDFLTLKEGETVPRIYYALPSNAEELSQQRAKGPLFSSVKEMALNAGRKREQSTEPDALEYLHGCLCRFTALAARLSKYPPAEPTAEPGALVCEPLKAAVRVANAARVSRAT